MTPKKYLIIDQSGTWGGLGNKSWTMWKGLRDEFRDTMSFRAWDGLSSLILREDMYLGRTLNASVLNKDSYDED